MPAEGSVEKEIQIVINGKSYRLKKSTPLTEFLRQFKFDSKHVAVVLNGEVIPHSQKEDKIIQNGDAVEVIRAVAGG